MKNKVKVKIWILLGEHGFYLSTQFICSNLKFPPHIRDYKVN